MIEDEKRRKRMAGGPLRPINPAQFLSSPMLIVGPEIGKEWDRGTLPNSTLSRSIGRGAADDAIRDLRSGQGSKLKRQRTTVQRPL